MLAITMKELSASADHTDEIRSSESSILEGRTILLAMCGSVAVLRCVELARLLIRNGAQVVPIMSDSACKMVGPQLVHWATGTAPITRLTGANEHVEYAGNGREHADLLLIAPATANTIGKIAHGIDDTVVTTFATTAIGQGLPIVIAPAMHEPMYNHPVVTRNLEDLNALGITVAPTVTAEGKSKMASPEHLLDLCIRGLPGAWLAGKHVVVTAGRTVEYLDPIRVITNNSSGKMGVAIARAAYRAGAEVTLIYGKGSATPPNGVRTVRVDTAAQMYKATLAHANSADILVAAAAVGDWEAHERASGKITTHGADTITVTLVPTPKIIDEVKKRNPGIFLVAFRAQHDLSREALLNDARARMKKASADMIAVNDVSHAGSGFETDTNELILIYSDGRERTLELASKQVVAHGIIEALASVFVDRQ